ncbi:MAG: RagB/SusD family nutrient uptake outer membrane protein [Chitinophagaceae bacterium]
MKNTYKIIIGICIIFLPALSCTKSVTLEPVSSISTASFWKTENDASGALVGMYARFRTPAATSLFLWGEGRSQDMKASFGVDFTNTRLFNNTLDATDAGPDWGTLYTVVHDANLILKYVPTIKFASDAAKNNILAQAYTMRAYLYFVMVRTWGAVPLVTEPTEAYDPEIINKERTSVADVFISIKKDIENAVTLFSDNTYSAGRNMWSKPGANALKADIFLWAGKRLNGGQADFTTALAALNTIETSDITLLPDFGRIFDYDNKGNKEIIMAVNFKELESTGTFMANLYVFSGLPTNISPEAKATIGQVGGDNYWTLHEETRLKFKDDDLRKKASFLEVYTRDAAGNYSVFFTTVQMKFNGVIISGVRNFYDDVVIYRYADVLLMKAEAKNALGQDPSADINKVRARAYGSNYAAHIFVNGSKDANDAAILDERLLELLYEGKRWWDILRFGKAFELIPFFRDKIGQDFRLLYPLSLKVLSLEPKVIQNTGY